MIPCENNPAISNTTLHFVRDVYKPRHWIQLISTVHNEPTFAHVHFTMLSVDYMASDGGMTDER
jgi:hypothetical protein